MFVMMSVLRVLMLIILLGVVGLSMSFSIEIKFVILMRIIV